MCKDKPMRYLAIFLFLGLACLTFRPGLWLVHKPAANGNSAYASGWQDGCISGTNAYSVLYAPLLDRPFVKQVYEVPDLGTQGSDQTTAVSDKTNSYKTGWNEGFTSCRYYQSAVHDLMHFAILITTLLYIGHRMSRQKH